MNIINFRCIYAGWWLSPTPLKNIKVNWDDHSQHMEKMFQTTNQYGVSVILMENKTTKTPTAQSAGQGWEAQLLRGVGWIELA